MEELFIRLSKSKFRSSFHLTKKDIEYIDKKGMDTIRKHAIDFINKNLVPSVIPNDGKQTPMRGHPVFVARHATATCCRGCLYKWHRIPNDTTLNQQEINYVIDVIMKWIENEYNSFKNKK